MHEHLERGASAPYRWVGIARQDCSYEPEPATPRSVMDTAPVICVAMSEMWRTVSQILGNPLDHSLYLALSWLVVRIHWAGFGVRVMYELVL